ncbi:MAG: S1 RNA-binding domain-containing protein, partial [Oscillibacter sp.]
MEPEIGSILEGKVTTITKFGAFVALENGKSGLVHISEIANSFVNDVHDFLQEGAAVRVKVLSNESGKINLSIKKALPQESR